MGNFGGPVFLSVRAPGESEKWRGEKRFFFFLKVSCFQCWILISLMTKILGGCKSICIILLNCIYDKMIECSTFKNRVLFEKENTF